MTFLDFVANGITQLSGWGLFFTFLGMTHMTIVSVTLYLHRCQAHRSLELHPFVSHIFRLWLWLSTGQNTKAWAAIHRKHHAKCETEEDPHSPQTRGLNEVLWKGAELYRFEAKNQETLDKYGHGTPDDWIERKLYTAHTTLGVSIMMPICWVLFGLGWGTAVWAGLMIWIPFHAAGVINGIAHYWGYRNNECADASRNITPWGIWIGGEELHNNHHTFATSPKFSFKPWEFDIGWMYIRILQFFRLAQPRNLPNQGQLLAVAKPAADMDTLEGVIAHRYELMSKYGKAMKAAFAAEKAELAAKIADSDLLKKAKNLLHKDETQLSLDKQAQLSAVVSASPQLQTLHSMRAELASLWGRSTLSREQLLAQLQDWLHRAEQSGSSQLSEMAQYVKRLAMKRPKYLNS